jgi:hypothetical protein
LATVALNGYQSLPVTDVPETSTDRFKDWSDEPLTTFTSVEETAEDDFMIFGLICALTIILVLAFACAAFFCGCGHLTCGFSINRYEQI